MPTAARTAGTVHCGSALLPLLRQASSTVYDRNRNNNIKPEPRTPGRVISDCGYPRGQPGDRAGRAASLVFFVHSRHADQVGGSNGPSRRETKAMSKNHASAPPSAGLLLGLLACTRSTCWPSAGLQVRRDQVGHGLELTRADRLDTRQHPAYPRTQSLEGTAISCSLQQPRQGSPG